MVIITFKQYSAFRQNLKDQSMKKVSTECGLEYCEQTPHRNNAKVTTSKYSEKNPDLSEKENLQYKKTADSV